MRLALLFASAMLAFHSCDLEQDLGGGSGGSTSTSSSTGTTTTSSGGGGASCTDGLADGLETDVDCGGPTCPKCANGKMCATNADCFGGSCVANVCQEGTSPSCTDGLEDGAETDVDCGGPDCAPCGVAKVCSTGSDCQSLVCSGGLCQAATCVDAIKNGTETDIDCGGPACAPCAVGKVCGANADCTSGECTGNVCQPTGALACSDGMKNGAETDIDCGGPICASCGVGRTCSVNTDCSSGSCVAGVCQSPSPSACNDGIKNGTETDVDCGGSACAPCNPGEMCSQASDCITLVCNNGFCGVNINNCGDGIKDGTETDVDCGGPACIFLCGTGKGCAINSDCASNVCVAQVCQ